MAAKEVDPLLNEFAIRFKEIREFKKKSQKEMSIYVNCALPTIQDVEASKMPLPGKSFIKLYNEGFDLNWLVGGGKLKMLRKDNHVETGQFRPELLKKVVEVLWKEVENENTTGVSPVTVGKTAVMLYEMFAGLDTFDEMPERAKTFMDIIRTVK